MTCSAGACAQEYGPERQGLRSEGSDGLSCFVFSPLLNLVRKVQVKSFSYLTQKSIPYQGYKECNIKAGKSSLPGHQVRKHKRKMEDTTLGY